MDIVLLSRIQFALTIGFHYFFPPLSIGLGLVLVLMEGMYLRTRQPIYHQMTRFWVRIFAAEGIFAFFLESGFLALLLFGWDKVSTRFHFFATIMVALGAHFSAIWIIVANSWMQTPTAYRIVETAVGPRAEVTSFWGAVLNPSTLDRLGHTLMGAWQAGAFFVISVAAFYLLKKQHEDFARRSMKVAFVVAVVASLGQLVSGHGSAVTVEEHQPTKLAAMEGIYETGESAELTIIGWVDEGKQKVYGIKIPGMLSVLVGGSPDTAYHLMVAMGMLLIPLACGGAFLAWRDLLWKFPQLLWVLVFAVLLPQAANQLGWATAEIGRQPWIVYNLMRTADAVSDTVSAGQVLFSMILFTLIYVTLFVVFIVLLDQKVRKGPLAEDLEAAKEVRS